ncbi:MAG: hypothetical protein ACE5GB_14640, partial [Acidimicrobiales bacterium]
GPAVVPEHDETVATGACVQAAAVLGRRPFSEIAAEWRLGLGATVDAASGVGGGRSGTRSTYRRVARLAASGG